MKIYLTLNEKFEVKWSRIEPKENDYLEVNVNTIPDLDVFLMFAQDLVDMVVMMPQPPEVRSIIENNEEDFVKQMNKIADDAEIIINRKLMN